jgi:polysaccharide chain length determinant protein (PEP-CTERM system associated)
LETNTLNLQLIVKIIQRRKYYLLVPFIFINIAAILTALLLPPKYRSSSTILVEEQEIPVEYVMTTVTSYVDKRLQEIKQKILSSVKLKEIIDKYALYREDIDKRTVEEIIDNMRDDINVELISADVIDKRTGRPTQATIAFTLTYQGKNNPEKVHQVTSVLTSLFLEENIKSRERQVVEASSFFEEEKNKIEVEMQNLEVTLSKFKNDHINELPEILNINIQDIRIINNEIDKLNEKMKLLKKDEANINEQLASVSSQLREDDRVNNIKLEINKLRSQYTDEYPPIISLKNEIEKIEKQKLIDKSNKTTNPAFANLNGQLQSVQSEIASTKNQIELYEKRKYVLTSYINATPFVEQEYRKILIDRDSLKSKYDDLMKKYMEAKVAQGLEKEQKGERFTLIDPPRIPEKPFKPNRLAIVLIGFVLATGAGIGASALVEMTDDTIRSTQSIKNMFDIPILGTVPLLLSEKDFTQKNRGRMKIAAMAAFLLVALLFLFHFFVMDFYIFWMKVSNKLGL